MRVLPTADQTWALSRFRFSGYMFLIGVSTMSEEAMDDQDLPGTCFVEASGLQGMERGMNVRGILSILSAVVLAVTVQVVLTPTAVGRAAPSGLWPNDFAAHQVEADCGKYRLDENDFCVANDSRNGLEVGVKFQTAREVSITGVRIYRTDPATVRGSLWRSDGTLLARGDFAPRSKNGWQDMSFAAPVAIVPGETYVASYFTPGTKYAFSYRYFATSGRTVGPITALQSAVDSPNGVHCYDDAPCGSFPVRGYRDTSYWVTPLWQELGEAPSADQLAPVVANTAPSDGAKRVKVGAAIKAKFSEAVRASGLKDSTVRLLPKGSTKPVRVRIRFDAKRNRLVLRPLSPLRRDTRYRVVISSKVRDLAGNRLDQNPVKPGRQPAEWTFRTR